MKSQLHLAGQPCRDSIYSFLSLYWRPPDGHLITVALRQAGHEKYKMRGLALVAADVAVGLAFVAADVAVGLAIVAAEVAARSATRCGIPM